MDRTTFTAMYMKQRLNRSSASNSSWKSAEESSVERGGGVLEMGRRVGGGGGLGPQNFVDRKWPDQSFPLVNFVFSHDGHFGLGGGVQPLLRWCRAFLTLPLGGGGRGLDRKSAGAKGGQEDGADLPVGLWRRAPSPASADSLHRRSSPAPAQSGGCSAAQGNGNAGPVSVGSEPQHPRHEGWGWQ